MILTIKTDQPLAQLALFDGDKQMVQEEWQGHKQLSDTILRKIDQVLEGQSKSLSELSGLVVFQGPGSFTGLRIGITVANTLSYGLDIPVIGAQGDSWQIEGVARLRNGDNEQIVKPVYGGEANITQPRK